MEKKSDGLDGTDRAILQLIQTDAFLTTKELASRIQMSTTPVFERVKRLERDGYILKYTALLDRHKIGLPMLAFCDISLKEHNRAFIVEFEEKITALPEVLECHHIAGVFDYLIKVAVRDMDHYETFIKNKLAELENIARVQSHFVMTEVKNSTAYSIELE